MAERTPDGIQREIEATRAELAGTIDAIADRVSPKKAVSRGASAVKAQVSAAVSTSAGPSLPSENKQLRSDRVLLTVGVAAAVVGGVVLLRRRKG